MMTSWEKIINGYSKFRRVYASNNNSTMKDLHNLGQNPEIMVLSCCDSRVDPAIIMQSNPGDLFVIRNVANIVPRYNPCAEDNNKDGTVAAMEFGIKFLNTKHFIIIGHSQCAGIKALRHPLDSTDFLLPWLSCAQVPYDSEDENIDNYAKEMLKNSYKNCMSFPWIKEAVSQGKLSIHLCFFEISSGTMYQYQESVNGYRELCSTLPAY
ncbi:carbonic anhydrase [Candidatus Ichthyocystis sparus]|uniref:Carbonic anhydrase n=2 Tax=Candidatus Ichthyocystis hellenicum TaxID=1561003 RepID=A0A0S4M1Z1_9BURK|nr:carbonic anhydrase [Candidatus Ichthyocystis sparus]CUT17795.1 Carbonic anhydrase [Candidatus Ichthyocystis hellenicum]